MAGVAIDSVEDMKVTNYSICRQGIVQLTFVRTNKGVTILLHFYNHVSRFFSMVFL